MKRYYQEPFNSEDMYRIPQGMIAQPSVYQLPKSDNTRKWESGSGKPYSILSASKYILMISLMLYWLPLLGQMIGGFIGGRRAGSPFRAILAALLPVIVLFGLSSALQAGVIPIRFQNATILTYTLVKDALERLPIAAPYVSFATTYVGSFIDELRTAASFKVGNYLITLAFAYVGGILSSQSRRELEYVSRYGAPTTNILVSGGQQPNDHAYARAILSKPAGFIHSLMPARRRTPAGFENMRALYPASSGMPPAPPAHQAHEGTQVHYRTGPLHYPERPEVMSRPQVQMPSSWDDVYGTSHIRQNVYRGAAENEAASYRGERSSYRQNAANAAGYQGPPIVKLYRAEGNTSDMSIIRKNKVKEESTRKLVERALGKDYMASLNRKHNQQNGKGRDFNFSQLAPKTVSAGENLKSGARKTSEWELL
ncbi:MAG: hypothetical protein M1442_01705 [Candidatus Thermoplasmatota archaeon]|nr:hypothetical protein [Candidatus Thermoplasmatota archaeon]